MIINFDKAFITAEDLYSKVSEKDIYEYYLNTPIKDSLLYHCPFHKDKTPSLGFKLMPSTMLIHRCFSCNETGSAINFVSKLFGCTYQDAIQRINKDLFQNQREPVSPPKENTKVISQGFTTEDNTIIIPEYQPFNIVDYNYWNQYYISLKLLQEYSISSCKRVFIKKIKENKLVLFAEYSNSNPIYCYNIGDKHKIYRPLNPTKRFKWLSTTKIDDIQGMTQLSPKGELLIITSSMKDLLVLKVLGYNAIALGGEGNRIPAKILDYLYASFDKILVFYDNDEAGIKFGKKLSSEIECNYFYIPTEYPEKDISDFIKSYGIEQTRGLLINLINDRR